ncbi:MAG TPA: ABC transporter permease [Bryobacteraceae bacterium]|nr:ABC transporter permease [Bryobacteraceae bacterium]
MATLLQDLRYAVRTLRKSPLFVSVAVLSLALGIGANTAIFTLINQLILQYLPVRHPEELVLLTGRGNHYGSNNGQNALSYPMYEDFRDKNGVFSGMFCRNGTIASLNYEGRTELVASEFVSGNYFPVLGVGAAAGRVFNASDDLMQGGHPLAVLSYAYWRARFGGDRAIIGKKIIVDGYPLTIIGVSQAGFNGVEPGSSPQIRIPITMHDVMPPGRQFLELNDRRRRFVQVFGRLKPGLTGEQAKAALQPLFHQILRMEVEQAAFAHASAYNKEQFLRMWMDVIPASKGQSHLREQFSKPLLALMAIVALVLLIACSNLANLLIARASSRQKEIAIRLALGAGRWRLIRQLLTESMLLSLFGGVAGMAIAVLLDRALISLQPADVWSITISTTPDASVLLFTLLVSLLTGVLFGLAPGLLASRPELAATLKDEAGSVAGGASAGLRKGLVVAQVALSLLLLVGAGLFLQSLNNLKELHPGFQTQNLVAVRAEPTLSRSYQLEWTRQYYRQLTEHLAALPGVRSVALAVIPVVEGWEWDNSVTIEGYTPKQGEDPDPHMQFCSSRFFETLKIPILLGRDFTIKDVFGAPKVAIVNERFAKRYFGEHNPLGRHIGFGSDPGTKMDMEIVAVVGDTKYESMREEVPYELYVPYAQQDWADSMTVYVKSSAPPVGLFGTLRRAIREVDANVPTYEMRTLDQAVANSLLTERMLATLSVTFGGLATLLAAIGLYGVMAFTVARRTREIGIRMALGANGGSVVRLIMREVLLLAGAGLAIGLAAALGLTRLVEAELFGVKPTDIVTLLLATLGIAIVVALAGYLPARRATTIDPMHALRFE